MDDQLATVPNGARRILPRPARLAAAFVTTTVTAATLACAQQVPSSSISGPDDRPTLELLASLVLPARPIGPGTDRTTHFGSVSGITRDPQSGRYLGIIDDHQLARAAWLNIRFAGDRLSVTIESVTPLVPGPGVDARRSTLADLEAVVTLPDGTFVASEEGHLGGLASERPDEAWPVALLHFGRDGLVQKIVDFPPAFAIGAEGVRANQGVEALAVTPDGRLVAGLEQPRVADGPPSTGTGDGLSREEHGLQTRLVEFVAQGDSWRPARQWMYPLAPTQLGNGFDRICSHGDNGLTELLALGPTTFLSLERACLLNGSGRARNTIGIYYVNVEGADDISGIPSLGQATVRGVTKQLVLDFDTIIDRLPPDLDYLDNFEAMALGPILPDGGRTLLVVSDDNFRVTQKTVFLLFRLTAPAS
jgi:hypothetical protein